LVSKEDFRYEKNKDCKSFLAPQLKHFQAFIYRKAKINTQSS
jgi:hypothetical protein